MPNQVDAAEKTTDLPTSPQRDLLGLIDTLPGTNTHKPVLKTLLRMGAAVGLLASTVLASDTQLNQKYLTPTRITSVAEAAEPVLPTYQRITLSSSDEEGITQVISKITEGVPTYTKECQTAHVAGFPNQQIGHPNINYIVVARMPDLPDDIKKIPDDPGFRTGIMSLKVSASRYYRKIVGFENEDLIEDGTLELPRKPEQYNNASEIAWDVENLRKDVIKKFSARGFVNLEIVWAALGEIFKRGDFSPAGGNDPLEDPPGIRYGVQIYSGYDIQDAGRVGSDGTTIKAQALITNVFIHERAHGLNLLDHVSRTDDENNILNPGVNDSPRHFNLAQIKSLCGTFKANLPAVFRVFDNLQVTNRAVSSNSSLPR